MGEAVIFSFTIPFPFNDFICPTTSTHFRFKVILIRFKQRYLSSSDMSKKDSGDLQQFIKPYPPKVQHLALWLREFVWDLYPNCNELIYDNYNAVAFGWSPTVRLGHTFCSIAVMPRYVHFGFYWGSELADPKKLLQGKGRQYRYIIVNEQEEFPVSYVRRLLKEAYANSVARVKDEKEFVKSRTIVKSISALKKRPGMPPGRKPGSKKIKSQL